MFPAFFLDVTSTSIDFFLQALFSLRFHVTPELTKGFRSTENSNESSPGKWRTRRNNATLRDPRPFNEGAFHARILCPLVDWNFGFSDDVPRQTAPPPSQTPPCAPAGISSIIYEYVPYLRTTHKLPFLAGVVDRCTAEGTLVNKVTYTMD